METSRAKHARVNIFDIVSYKKRLKPGQIKAAYVYITPEGDKKTWVGCMVLKVYRHIAQVRYWITVSDSFSQREVQREDTVKIKDLFIWEMYGENKKPALADAGSSINTMDTSLKPW